VSGRRRVKRLSSLAPKNPRKGVAVDEHTRVQSGSATSGETVTGLLEETYHAES
jgi:hypothetical protein